MYYDRNYATAIVNNTFLRIQSYKSNLENIKYIFR